MDKIDRKILSLLQENARYPLKYLAQKVFLSSPAVSTRIERLEKAGILTGYHATIDPVALGYHYRTSAKIWEHTDTDCILYCCSPKRSWHRNRRP